ncbi:MAG: hypothetical protein ABIH85_06905 [Candidatus Omnitrophota bacterium]
MALEWYEYYSLVNYMDQLKKEIQLLKKEIESLKKKVEKREEAK